ncbi:MAG: DALR anticodon-binding domain-containing protein [Candidatus Eremiobacteraeota bacterium]|nr:DALR anticodon-binding domain-containing protein [Candidatus Eremiobacteraeota bacterium]
MYRKQITEMLEKAIKQAVLLKVLPECEAVPATVEVCRHDDYGDYCSPVALRIATKLSMEPALVAKKIIGTIEYPPSFCQNISSASNGFINITLSKDALSRGLFTVIQEKESFGRENIGAGEKVHISSIDTARMGFLNVDDGRRVLIGNFLYQVMQEMGFDVQLAPFIRNQGESIWLLGISVEARYRELLGDDSPIPHDGYKSKLSVELAREILDEDGAVFLQSTKAERINVLKDKASEKIASSMKRTLKEIGIEYQQWTDARQLAEKDRTIGDLQERFTSLGFLYEKDEQVWIKSTSFGDQKDRLFLTEHREPSDYLVDLSVLLTRIGQGYGRNIYIKPHEEAFDFFTQMSLALKVLGYRHDLIEVLAVARMKIGEAGHAEDIHKGESMSFEELVKSAGTNAVRFFYYLKSINTALEFDVTLAHKESNINPLYYIQSALSRIKSVFKMAEGQGISPLRFDLVHIKMMDEKADLALIKKIVRFPSVISDTIQGLEPYYLAYYMADLVNDFHSYYGNTKILSGDPSLVKGRLALLEALRIVLARIIDLFQLKLEENS